MYDIWEYFVAASIYNKNMIKLYRYMLSLDIETNCKTKLYRKVFGL